MFEGFESLTVPTTGAEIHLVKGGSGPPLLLLHGYPQTHAMWHKIAPRLAEDFTVVAPDLRGYGDSSKPPGSADHREYSKRAMAGDMAETMAALGFDRFRVAGHDRGARVTHRLALDHPARVEKLALLDIAPTYHMYNLADKEFATVYYHWFFLIQPYDFPERMIGHDPEYFLRTKLSLWSRQPEAFLPEAVAEYVRCFSDPAAIHASCEDYRAAASIDLADDEADRQAGRKITRPALVLWGKQGFVGRKYPVLEVWRDWAGQVEGRGLDAGHFLPEEAPGQTYQALVEFFKP